MTSHFAWSVVLVLNVVLAAPVAGAESATSGPPLKEVIELARKGLPNLRETELDQLAAQGLLAQLRSNGLVIAEEPEDSAAPCLASSRIFEERYACLRLARVGAGAAGEFRKAFDELASPGKLKGLVIDLRFADGHDYPAAAELADLFLSKAQTLFNVGDGTYRSHEKTNSISLRCVVLINRETAAAAEALAGTLREAGVSLLIGNATAGRAKVWRSFSLSDGTRLMLAGDPVKLSGGNEIPLSGITPDIVVPVKLEEDRKFIQDPFLEPDRGGSARVSRPRVNEAQLVRERNNGSSGGNIEPVIDPADADHLPVVRDPVLARALDLLKGLAVVRPVGE